MSWDIVWVGDWFYLFFKFVNLMKKYFLNLIVLSFFGGIENINE